MISKGFKKCYHSGLAIFRSHGQDFTLGLVLLGACRFPRQMFYIPGVSNFLEFSVHLEIYNGCLQAS